MVIKKVGCVIVDIKNKKIGLVYRSKSKDYSFPKGHLENNETLEYCALRETEEETGRIVEIVKELPVMRYINSSNDKVENHMFLAIDKGESLKEIDIKDREELVWEDIDCVEGILTYNNLKVFWNNIKSEVNELFN